MQEGHGVYDCCDKCGEFIKYDGIADAEGTYHRKCLTKEEEAEMSESLVRIISPNYSPNH
jgi:hypothetical protein